MRIRLYFLCVVAMCYGPLLAAPVAAASESSSGRFGFSLNDGPESRAAKIGSWGAWTVYETPLATGVNMRVFHAPHVTEYVIGWQPEAIAYTDNAPEYVAGVYEITLLKDGEAVVTKNIADFPAQEHRPRQEWVHRIGAHKLIRSAREVMEAGHWPRMRQFRQADGTLEPMKRDRAYSYTPLSAKPNRKNMSMTGYSPTVWTSPDFIKAIFKDDTAKYLSNIQVWADTAGARAWHAYAKGTTAIPDLSSDYYGGLGLIDVTDATKDERVHNPRMWRDKEGDINKLDVAHLDSPAWEMVALTGSPYDLYRLQQAVNWSMFVLDPRFRNRSKPHGLVVQGHQVRSLAKALFLAKKAHDLTPSNHGQSWLHEREYFARVIADTLNDLNTKVTPFVGYKNLGTIKNMTSRDDLAQYNHSHFEGQLMFAIFDLAYGGFPDWKPIAHHMLKKYVEMFAVFGTEHTQLLHQRVQNMLQGDEWPDNEISWQAVADHELYKGSGKSFGKAYKAKGWGIYQLRVYAGLVYAWQKLTAAGETELAALTLEPIRLLEERRLEDSASRRKLSPIDWHFAGPDILAGKP